MVKRMLMVFLLGAGLVHADLAGDDHGNTAASASSLALNTPVNGTCNADVDRDFFSFLALPHRSYTIQATASGTLDDVEFRLVDSNQAGVLMKEHSVGAANAQSILAASTVARTLYVDVRSFAEFDIGNYQLLVTEESVTDTDGDGLPNSYESANGLNPNSSVGVNGATGDLDGDGHNNLDEMFMGTQPNSSSSNLGFSQVAKDTGEAELRFQAVLGARYRICSSPTIISPTWTEVTAFTHTAPSGEFIYTDPDGATPGRKFYKVEFVTGP